MRSSGVCPKGTGPAYAGDYGLEGAKRRFEARLRVALNSRSSSMSEMASAERIGRGYMGSLLRLRESARDAAA